MVMDVDTLADMETLFSGIDLGQGVDGDTCPPHLALGQGVVRVAAQERRHVEGGGQAVATGPQELLEAAVRVLRRPEAGELAHGPQAGAVHGRMGTPRVGVLAGQLGALGTVDRLERHARHCLEACRAHLGAVERVLPGCPVGHDPHIT
jgi:hypothetical protein